MFLESFKITGSAVVQILILGAIGYALVKKDILGDTCLDTLSRLTIDITLPILIFCQLIKDFNFGLYANWWIFPLISIAITILGLVVGAIFSVFIRGSQHKLQFISLVAFQNSGYLPLALIAALLSPDKAGLLFIYLFLFLLGFNIVMFSFGAYLLSFSKTKEFELASLFSPPVAVTIVTLFLVFIGFNRIVPDFIFKPLKLVGDCTLPLAMIVVGGNLAQIHLGRLDIKAIIMMALAKLIILPLLGIMFLAKIRLPELIGLLIIIELAMPSATLLSVINRHQKKDDLLIGQGIFFGHILSLVTIPLFLSWYFMLQLIK
jgi:predicted permease